MEKIVSRPYNKAGEETHERVFGKREYQSYLPADDKRTAIAESKTGKELESHD